MAKAFGEEALREFLVALDELEANLQFLVAASRLRPRLNGILRWETMDAPAKTLVRDYITRTSAELTLLYRGMIIAIAGAFEQFVRRVAEEAVVLINRSVQHYDALPEAIKNQNMFRTGRSLSTILEPPDHLGLDYYALCTRIATCIPGSANYTLNAEAFGTFISSVSPAHLVEIFHWVGVELNWDEFGQDQNLRHALDLEHTRETAKAITEYLQLFIRTRNRIAHTGSGGITVTTTDIEQSLRFFRAFARRFPEVVYKQLRQ